MKITILKAHGLLILGPTLVSCIVLGPSCNKSDFESLTRTDPITGKKKNIIKGLVEAIMDGTEQGSFKTWNAELKRNLQTFPAVKKEFEEHFPAPHTETARKSLIARTENVIGGGRAVVKFQKTASEAVPEDEILIHCGLEGLTKDPTDPKFWEYKINGESSYLDDKLYQECKADPSKVEADGKTPSAPVQAFTFKHQALYKKIPDTIYLCPQWFAWLKHNGGLRQEPWIYEAIHIAQTTRNIPHYTPHWPQSAITAQVKTWREDATSHNKAQWISENQAARAQWTLAHEISHTEKFKDPPNYDSTGTRDTPEDNCYERDNIMKHHELNNADTVASAYMSFYRNVVFKMRADVPGEYDPKWVPARSVLTKLAQGSKAGGT